MTPIWCVLLELGAWILRCLGRRGLVVNIPTSQQQCTPVNSPPYKVTNMLVFLSLAMLLQLYPSAGTLTLASSCASKLGMESGKILDYQLSASSSDGSVVGPHNVNIRFIKIFWYWLTEDKTTVRSGLVCKVIFGLHTSLLGRPDTGNWTRSGNIKTKPKG